MATKQKGSEKRRPKAASRKPETLRAQNAALERELHEFAKENRQLKKSLGAVLCKDLPVNMDLTPEDGVAEPSLMDLIAELRHRKIECRPAATKPMNCNLPAAAQQIRDLATIAAGRGLKNAFLDAVATVVAKLQTEPSRWGDPEFNLRKPGAVQVSWHS